MAATTGQTINDRLNAVRYALAGQGLQRAVCKATTEEVAGPKKKHIDYLLACTEEPNISIPELAKALIERTQNTSWAVVFKALITIHHLMNFGNERFTQYLATSNHSFELADFMDRTTPQGYGMSTFVRRYAKYINDKIGSYKSLAIDLCKIKPGKDNALRTMNMDNLGKTLPLVHAQFDALLEFGVEQKDLNNGIIMAAFKLLYKDLNRIFAAYQEAIINLVERYFKLSRKKARDALAMYKRYLDRMDKVAAFFKVVEQIGLDKNEMPDTSKLSSLLGVLEEHLAQLEAKKRGATPASPEGAGGEDDREESVSPLPERVPAAAAAAAVSKPDEPKEQARADEPRTGRAHDPPPPPARPSPKASPKASPKEPKPPPSAPEHKKAAPPERPAKPPSRPPPPSGAPAASVAAAAKPSSAQTHPGETGDKQSAAVAVSSASPTPPSRPPPAHPAQPKASSPVASSSAEAQTPSPPSPPPPVEVARSATTENQSDAHQGASAEAGQENAAVDERVADEPVPTPVDGQNGNGLSDAGDQIEDRPTEQPACSSTLSETANAEVGTEARQEQGEAGQQEPGNASETNHVLANHGVAEDQESQPSVDARLSPPPPPPPPPVEDEALDPGQANDGGNSNENHHEVDGMPAPPPPVEDDA